ncbi:MAG: hypothetical protein LBL79_13020 [Prevotella sp.]|jgi:hypothetical protein|nr:hypothetical protein [Prevotella sp.]
MEDEIMSNVKQEIYEKLLIILQGATSGPLSDAIIREMGAVAKEDLEILLDNIKFLENKGFVASRSPSVTKDHHAGDVRCYLEDLYVLQP